MSVVLTPALASVVPRFCDHGRGPSHDELTLVIQQTGLASADPGPTSATGPVGKMKRLRRVLTAALSDAPEEGGRLVVRLVEMVRAVGGFSSESDQYIGEDVCVAAQRAFAEIGYLLDPEGHVRPRLLDNLEGAQLTEALWVYVRRARTGVTDAALVVGTAKDISEAVARHVVVELAGSYSPTMGVPGTIFHAYHHLGLIAPDPKILEQLDPDPRLALQQAVYILACTASRYRNSAGAGHGRPSPSTADALDGRLCAEAAGLLGDLLLTKLEHLRR